MRERVVSAVEGLMRVTRFLAAALLLLSVVLNFTNVIGRYFFHVSISWAEEGMLFLMVGCVFLGSGVVAWSGRHIRMDVLLRPLPDRAKSIFDFTAEVALVATAVVLVFCVWPAIRQLVAFDQRSLAADIPLAIPQSMVPLGLAIMALVVAVRLLTGRWRGGGTKGH